MLRELWALLCTLGAWGWIACTIGFILSAFPRRGAFNGRLASLWGAGVVVCYLLWFVGMAKA